MRLSYATGSAIRWRDWCWSPSSRWILPCSYGFRLRRSATQAKEWGNYIRTGNATIKFQQTDRYVVRRLYGLMRKRYGRNLRRGQWEIWTREWFEANGLYRLRGTIRYPGYAL